MSPTALPPCPSPTTEAYAVLLTPYNAYPKIDHPIQFHVAVPGLRLGRSSHEEETKRAKKIEAFVFAGSGGGAGIHFLLKS